MVPNVAGCSDKTRAILPACASAVNRVLSNGVLSNSVLSNCVHQVALKLYRMYAAYS